MSYNCDNSKIVNGELFMKQKDILDLQYKLNLEDKKPEDCFLDSFSLSPSEYSGELIKLENIRWCGIWSGGSYKVFEEEVIPKMVGEAVIVETWERGDATEIYRIKDGKKEPIKTI